MEETSKVGINECLQGDIYTIYKYKKIYIYQVLRCQTVEVAKHVSAFSDKSTERPDKLSKI